MGNDATTDDRPLPAALHWSASLAAESNRREAVDDALHGLIDATVPTVMQHWVAGDGWCLLRSLPADARKLVCDGPSTRPVQVGDVLDGFCGGWFGRDSYGQKHVEAVGNDWVVAREDNGELVFADRPHMDVPRMLAQYRATGSEA